MAKRGRPAFKVTAKLQREVEQMVACGMSEDSVARAIGCSTPTLQKHFHLELLTGRDRRRAEVIKLLFKAARAGNVSAQKKLEDMTGIAATARPAAAEAAQPKAPKLGKKEAADLAAQTPDASTSMGELMAQRMADAAKVH